jgi:hypothetical protein
MNKKFVYQPYNEKIYQINNVQTNINKGSPNIMPIPNNMNIVPNINAVPINFNNNNLHLNNNMIPYVPSNNYIKPTQTYNFPPIQYN